MAAGAVRTAETLTTEIADVKMIVPRIHRDRRGLFSETYNKGRLEVLRAKLEFVQDNHSLSVERGVVVNVQIPPSSRTDMYVILGSRLLTSITFAVRKET
jgi:dTDP-4-dehydrorhamnose 3,5-epimerase